MCQSCEKLHREKDSIDAELRAMRCGWSPRKAYYREYYQRHREQKLQRYQEKKARRKATVII